MDDLCTYHCWFIWWLVRHLGWMIYVPIMAGSTEEWQGTWNGRSLYVPLLVHLVTGKAFGMDDICAYYGRFNIFEMDHLCTYCYTFSWSLASYCDGRSLCLF
jgi:hypothetical protein